MVVRDRSGYRKTPNGCYYHIEYVELVDIDIKTGKYIIKPLEEKDFEKLTATDIAAILGEVCLSTDEFYKLRQRIKEQL